MPPTRIERATRGLGIVANPTSDNLNPQEATNQADLEVGADGAGLSCPGSNVVAAFEGETVRFENVPASETIGCDLRSSVQSQSLTGESEVEEAPIRHDRAR